MSRVLHTLTADGAGTNRLSAAPVRMGSTRFDVRGRLGQSSYEEVRGVSKYLGSGTGFRSFDAWAERRSSGMISRPN